jgi:hypothetical protein
MVSILRSMFASGVGIILTATAACGGSPPPPAAPPTAPTPISTSPPISTPTTTAAKPLDPNAIATATGAKPEVTDQVVKVSFPRNDVAVSVDSFAKMPPFMGLTSWAAFTPGVKSGVEAMVMGDLVVFEDEAEPVMSAALDNGLAVTALHNHFFYDKPHVLFMHIGGEGSVEVLARGVKAAVDAQAAVRKASPQPRDTFGTPPVASPSHVDAAKLDALFGLKGTAKDGMYKVVMGRKTTASCGCSVGKAMGVSTWAAFAGTDDSAVVDGDFAVAETELQPVLKALRAGGINVVAIHSHMTEENPRILFMHYWGRGAAADLAKTVKRAVDLTAWDGRSQST